MNTSDKTDKVLPALLSAAADFKAVTFDATNSHFKSKYATLPAYLEAVSPALRARGLLLTQGTRIADTGTIVLTRITHAESGQWVGSEYPVHPVKPDPQAEGSALTYARRYALAALLGLAADDDDGNAASKGKAPEKEPQQQPEEIAKNAHDAALGRHSESVKYIKDCLSDGRIREACEEWAQIPEKDQRALWLAPTKGGVLTTAERQTIKDNASKHTTEKAA